MAQLIRINFISLVSILCFTAECQIKNVRCIEIVSDIEKQNFNRGDTIKIAIVNSSGRLIQYQMEVMMYYRQDWIYSPYYTRYFNRDLTYEQLMKSFNSKLPNVFSQDYKHSAMSLKPDEANTIKFPIEQSSFSDNLVRFRFRVITGSDDCKMIYSKAFYFKKLEW